MYYISLQTFTYYHDCLLWSTWFFDNILHVIFTQTKGYILYSKVIIQNTNLLT